MGEAALDHRLSVEAYLAMEAEAELRHEYHAGEIFAMAGGTRNHGSLGNAINTELNLICRSRSCRPFNGDVRVWIGQGKRFLYPEASVVCGEVEPSPEDA
ncbi:MAG: Uma2 family endonuclease, partial [Bacteroidota bacterium]